MLHQIKLPKHLSKHLKSHRDAVQHPVPLAGYISSNFFPAQSKLQANGFEMQFNPEF
jgi:hypothetical protein